jgi:hypothetical protein
MKRVFVVCEGPTEEMFVSNVLAPAFNGLGLNLIPQMIATSPGHHGGGLSYERVKRHLRNTLRQKSSPTVTTFLDQSITKPVKRLTLFFRLKQRP